MLKFGMFILYTIWLAQQNGANGQSKFSNQYISVWMARTHTHTHTHTHTPPHTHKHTYIHTHIHTHIHIYIHTYIRGNRAAAVISRYRMSHSTTDQSSSGHPPKMAPQIAGHLHNLALRNRQVLQTWHRVIKRNGSFCDSSDRAKHIA